MSLNVDRLLAFRAPHIVARLGPSSRLPLLTPRDLLGPGALVCVPVTVERMLPGLLRAAREDGAVVGLSCPHGPGDREAPGRFFRSLKAVAEDEGHRLPVFLQAGPLRLSSSSVGRLEAVAESVFRFVDAGFTAVAVDASRLELTEAAQVVAAITRTASEQGMSIEVELPGAGESEESLSHALDAASRAGLRPTFVRFKSAELGLDGSSEAAPSAETFERVRGLVGVALNRGISVSLEDWGMSFPVLSQLPQLGIRKVDATQRFARRIVEAHDREVPSAALGEALIGRARSAALPLDDLLAMHLESFDALSDSTLARLEAVSFGLSADLFEALGQRGSSSRAGASLSAQPPGANE